MFLAVDAFPWIGLIESNDVGKRADFHGARGRCEIRANILFDVVVHDQALLVAKILKQIVR